MFERALHQTATEAEAARLRFEECQDGLQQFVSPTVEFTAPHVPVRDRLWISRLIKISADHFVWYHRSHHILLDGFGGGLFARRLAETYSALIEHKTPRETSFGPFAELLAEDRVYRDSERFCRDRDYWMTRFADQPEPVTLATRQAPNEGGLLRRTCQLPADVVGGMRDVARQVGSSLPQLMIAATAAYFHRITGVQDLVLGLPVTGRLSKRLRQIPGLVANVVPLRVTAHPTMSVQQLMQSVGRQVRESLRHQCYRYEDLRRDLHLLAAQPLEWLRRGSGDLRL